MSQSYFITGTDTGIGKTLVAAALLQLAKKQGLSTLGLKPVAAGCELIDGQWMNDDARELMLASSIEPAYSVVNPLALREAIAPHIAAEHEGIAIQAGQLASHCQKHIKLADFTVIEGAGGWQVPLNGGETMADLATAIACPVILVVGLRLGCINHALLTAAAIEQTGLQLAGWVANGIDPNMFVPAQNISTLRARLNAPMLGQIPWLATDESAAGYLKLP
jgi:dethiobiotin synthetase